MQWLAAPCHGNNLPGSIGTRNSRRNLSHKSRIGDPPMRRGMLGNLALRSRRWLHFPSLTQDPRQSQAKPNDLSKIDAEHP